MQIGHILSIGNGRDYKHLKEGDIPVFGTGGKMTSVNNYLYEGASAFIGRKGTINKPFFYEGKFWTVDTLFYTYAFRNVSPKFVYCLFQNINWLKYNEASGVPSLSKSTIEKIKVRVPTQEEQDKIAKLIFAIDERIATQIGLIEDLKKLKSAIRMQLYKGLKRNKCYPCEIKELLNYEQPTDYVVSDTEYSSDKSLIPVLTANKAFVLGYTAEKTNVYDKGNCIIFDDFTLDAKYVTFPFKVKSSAIKILTAKKGVNIKFMYECLLSLNLKSEEHKRHYISEVEPLIINVPTLAEQGCIAERLSAIEQKIAVETKIKECFVRQQQFLLNQMFV